MTEKQLIGQLRSGQGRRAALRHLQAQGGGALSPAVATELIRLYEVDEGARELVAEVIVRHPTDALLPAYERLLLDEPDYRRARAVELLPLWAERLPLGDLVPRSLAAAQQAESPWLVFVGALMSARLGTSDLEAVSTTAAEAIIASRAEDPMRCIRPQAEERLDEDELAAINRVLADRGQPPLRGRSK